MRDSFLHALSEHARSDKSVILLTADLGFGVFEDFASCFPSQYLNAGISEQNMSSMAAGLAMEGHTVYTYSIANFPTIRCLEQIRNDICYHDCNVTIVSTGAGFSYGQLGMSHFSTEDLSILRSIPNMTLLVPSDPWEVGLMMRQARHLSGPKYLRLDKTSAGIPNPEEHAPIGSIRRAIDGSDLTIVCIGGIASECLKAIHELNKDGISCRLLIVNSLKPIDPSELILAIQDTGGLITVEEHSVIGGLGTVVCEIIARSSTRPGFFVEMSIPDSFPSVVGDQHYLRNHYGLSSSRIFAKAKESLSSLSGSVHD